MSLIFTATQTFFGSLELRFFRQGLLPIPPPGSFPVTLHPLSRVPHRPECQCHVRPPPALPTARCPLQSVHLAHGALTLLWASLYSASLGQTAFPQDAHTNTTHPTCSCAVSTYAHCPIRADLILLHNAPRGWQALQTPLANKCNGNDILGYVRLGQEKACSYPSVSGSLGHYHG